MYRYGFSSEVGVWFTVVYGGLGKLWAGTPVSPTNTMFQFEPVQLPSLSLRMMNCCWVPELTWPVTTESLMKPPEDQLLVVLPEVSSSSTRFPSICTRRIGSACDTAHSVLPEDGSMVMFSTPRQKFCVAFPPLQAASTWMPPPVITVCDGFCPRPTTSV